MEHGDGRTRERIAEAYLPDMEAYFDYERPSRDLPVYESRKVLLLHANALNADCFAKPARMISERGSVFVPRQRAREDPA